MSFFCGAVEQCRWSLTYGKLDDGDLTAYVANVARLGEITRPHVVLDLVHDISLPTPTQRRAVAQAVQDLPLAQKRLIAGHAVVSSSAIGRGVLTAINWFVSERPFPERVFATPEKALGWLRERLPEVAEGAVLLDIARTVPHFRSLAW